MTKNLSYSANSEALRRSLFWKLYFYGFAGNFYFYQVPAVLPKEEGLQGERRDNMVDAEGELVGPL